MPETAVLVEVPSEDEEGDQDERRAIIQARPIARVTIRLVNSESFCWQLRDAFARNPDPAVWGREVPPTQYCCID